MFDFPLGRRVLGECFGYRIFSLSMLMSQPRQFQLHHQYKMGGGGSSGGGGQFNDTTFTKIFVGGLAWETQRDTMRKYFEEFGEILEAVVITDKATGRSKGYGFVTFKDAEAALRSCQNPTPVIDGRKANCNLASLGAQKNRSPAASHHQVGDPRWFRSAGSTPGLVAPCAFPASTYFHLQQSAQLTFPYSAYGYTGFSHDAMYPVSCYGVYGSQQHSPYYTGGGGGGSGGGAAGYMYRYYGSCAVGQGSQAQHQHQHHGGYGVHYNHPAAGLMLQYPYFPQQQQQQHYFPSTSGILSLPDTSLAFPAAAISLGLTPTAGSQSGAGLGQVHPPQAAGASGAVPENNSSTT